MNIKKNLINSLHLLYLLSSILPKSPRIWVFGSWFGQRFADNPRAVFLHALARGNITCVWVTRSSMLARTLRSKGYVACHYASLRGIYYQMRAGAAFFTHDTSIDLLGPAISRRTLRIQLWHGTPLKRIRYGNEKHESRGNLAWRRFWFRLFPWLQDTDYDFVPAASPDSVGHLRQAFQTEEVIVTGYPRNDVLLPGRVGNSPQLVQRCIYMPTFRGGFRTEESSRLMESFLQDSGFDVDCLDSALSAMGVALVLRLHPTNVPGAAITDRIRRSSWIRLDDSEDIYTDLNDYDVLITDYSSIFFDYMITGKPVIHAAFDLEEYRRNSRDLYFSYDDVCLTPWVRSWVDVLALLQQFRDTGMPPDYAARYENIASRFNYYRDRDASRRVYDRVHERLTGGDPPVTGKR